ncbi:MAG: hypothetical protein H7258_01360, partial [Ferruginibacter sp.]|nr:hypothetical protein [Ferruginibacter sp.]
YYLTVPGISINDHFQVLDKFGSYNHRVYMMAVPHIGGLNPDYSGLDFCETAAKRIANAIRDHNRHFSVELQPDLLLLKKDLKRMCPTL